MRRHGLWPLNRQIQCFRLLTTKYLPRHAEQIHPVIRPPFNMGNKFITNEFASVIMWISSELTHTRKNLFSFSIIFLYNILIHLMFFHHFSQKRTNSMTSWLLFLSTKACQNGVHFPLRVDSNWEGRQQDLSAYRIAQLSRKKPCLDGVHSYRKEFAPKE